MATTNDEPDGQPTNGTRPATDQPPSTVAEEAALLVDLLSRRGWGVGGGMPSASSHAHDHGARDETAGPEAPGHTADGATGAGARPSGIPLADAQRGPECTCGGREPAACRVCPVCQLISFVQQVNPDTIERVADFVGFAATALRDLATAQRERSERPSGAESPEPTEPTPSSQPTPSTEPTQASGRPGAARDDAEAGPA